WTAPFAASSLSATVDMNVSGDWTNAGNQTYSGKLHLKLVKVFTPDGVETDKFIWHQVIPTPFPRRSDFVVAEFKDRLFVIGGSTGTTAAHDIWYSDKHGNYWTQTLIPSNNYLPSGTDKAIEFNDKLWSIGVNGVYSSSDGIKFDKISSQNMNVYNLLNFNNKLLALCSIGAYESENGKDWQAFTPSSHLVEEKNKVVVYKNKIYSLTNAGDVYCSSDGHTSVLLKSGLYGLILTVYDDNLCIIDNDGGVGVHKTKIYQSTDGKNWVSSISNGREALLAFSNFANFNNRLYAFWSDSGHTENWHSEVWYLDPTPY
ncbi:MAG TPA: hypothetical protein DF296_13280, partial [Candidatus Margulisbacteria bacterium]|nr:hypothetical protein [Candidatus Margulisiibacteriota bacterium]